MKIEETVEVPATTRTIVAGLACDLCRKIVRGDDWAVPNSTMNTDEVTIRREYRHYMPYDGGSGVDTEVDLCPECFTNRLVPWLRSEGAEVRTTELDW